MCVYGQHLLLKEAVIAKPHLFKFDTWSSCRLSQDPRLLAGTDGGGSAVGPPLFSPPAGGRQTHSVNPSKLMEVGTSPTLRGRHLGGPASHLSFTRRQKASGSFMHLCLLQPRGLTVGDLPNPRNRQSGNEHLCQIAQDEWREPLLQNVAPADETSESQQAGH